MEQTAPRCPAKAPGCKLLGKRAAGCVSNGKQWPSVPWAALQGCSLHICLGISDPGAVLHPCPPPAQLWESLSIHSLEALMPQTLHVSPESVLGLVSEWTLWG